MVYVLPEVIGLVEPVLERLEPALQAADVLVHQHQKIRLPSFLVRRRRERRSTGTLTAYTHCERHLTSPADPRSLSIFPSIGRFSRWAMARGLEPTIMQLWDGKPARELRRSKQLFNLLTRDENKDHLS